MSLTILPRFGTRQATAANAYFTRVIQDLLEEEAGPLVPTHYMITERAHDSVPVRLWEDPARPRVSMEDHLHLLGRVEEAVLGAANGTGSVEEMEKVVSSIPHHLDSEAGAKHTFVLERLDPDDAFTANERGGLVIGVVDGLMTFIRSEEFTLVQLEPGLYGCSVRAKGSYLIEVQEGVPVEVDARR